MIGYGLGGLLVLILDIYCLYLVLTGSAEPVMKLVWVLVILVFPLVGAILYLIIGGGRAAV